MKKARFPYGRVRDGQNEFMSLVYKNLTRGGTLYAAAPTGTGKTVSVLYPAVRALGDGKCDKIFYFTPKTTTAIAAKECIEDICAQGAVIRAVTLGAKERVCRRGVLCRDGKGNCPSKLGESLINAALELYGMNISVVTDADILPIAEKFSVCPHELSLTYSELCDVIILDINYLFDPRVYIKRYFTNGGDFAFLIDEAHNLPDRAREMYSCEISTDEILEPSE
jgi:Rad3-related DNA helicase